MHKLLQRQLKRHLTREDVPPELRALLEAVSQAYTTADEDRELVERALELTSQELLGANAQLRRDLEALSRAHAELDQQRRELLEINQRLPFPVLIRHGDRCVFVNEAWAQRVGHTPAELLGRSLLDLIHPDDVQPAQGAMAAADAGGATPPVSIRFKKKGSADHVELELHAVGKIRFDGVPSVLMAGFDVTERKLMQARLMSADRMVSVGTLAAGIAHEINNPLAYVIGNLTFIAKELTQLPGVEDTELVPALVDARQGAARVSNIVRDLKSFSRAEEQPFGPVNVEDVLDSATNIARNEIRHKAKLTKAFERVPPVSGDEGRLGQLFLNLLINAAQAMPEGAADKNEIRVGTHRNERGSVVIEIADTGSGIPPEIRRRIFDPFFTTKPVGVGTGLGLYICQGIVTDHHGDLEVESEPGRGTLFRITLPAAGASAALARPTPPMARVWRGRRLLVIDDEPNVGVFIRRVLQSEYDVEVSTDAREALSRCVAGDQFDVILCDVMMPAMTGADLHRELQKARPDLAARMVFMSGGAFSPDSQRFLQQVPNRLLEKPLDEKVLRDALEGALH